MPVDAPRSIYERAIDSMRETEGTLHERGGRPRSACVIVERVYKWEWVPGRCTVVFFTAWVSVRCSAT